MPVVRRRVSVCTWSWMRKSLTCSKSCPCVTCIVLLTAGALITYYQLCCAAPPSITMDRRRHGPWSDNILDYFLSKGLIKAKDGSEIVWDHAVNSQEKLREALQSDVHMIEADVLLRGSADREPIMAHPPETDSDITLKDWLAAVSASNKGIKLDFKRWWTFIPWDRCSFLKTNTSVCLDAVSPSMKILDTMKNKIEQPVWINADILAGPGGIAKAVDAGEFMQMVTSSFPDVTLSLGWTTGWHPQKNNKVTRIHHDHVIQLALVVICGNGSPATPTADCVTDGVSQINHVSNKKARKSTSSNRDFSLVTSPKWR
ncbi:protein FAM151B isoform X3 [Pseudophryne corroboree]|uniref:protein FAM151B isoform X3 n=1 Tax=Pseudophryne corroboree TaxID=495146 RepID=UPI0030819529